MKKLLVRGIVGLLVLVIVLGIVGYILLDVLAKKGVEEGGTYALGVQTRLDSLSLSPFSGTLAMGGLNVANPAGYKSPHLMHSGTFDLEVVPSSVLDDTIQVRKFELNGLDLNVEQKGLGKSNISEVLDNLKRLGGPEKPQEQKPDEEKGKKVKVDRIVIRNVSASFYLPMSTKPLSVKVPEIKLENITSDNAEGVVVPELIARLVPAILAAVLENGKGIVPGDVLGGLNQQVSGAAQALGGQAQKLVGDAQGQLGKVLGGEGVGAAGKAVEGVKKTVGGALEGVLGGKKDANQPAKKPAGGLLDNLLGGKKEGN